jgi:imidazolonepropionase-like amidohydrolase
MIFEEMLRGIEDALRHEITIGMGTDSALTYVTHYDTWREMDLLVRYGGFTPAQALNAATQTNARILGLDQITGSIESGKDADMVVLDVNPIDEFRAFTNIRMVVVRGDVIDKPSVTRHAELDERLDSI